MTLAEGAARNSRIVVCSADALRRDALSASIGTVPGFAVVGQASDERQLLRLARLRNPDTGVIDAASRVGETLPGVHVLRDRCPRLRLIVVYEHATALEYAAVRGSGVTAAVPYSRGLRGLLSVLQGLPDAGPPSPAGNELTARQREILLLLASGHQAGEIARILGISPGTVGSHIRRIYARLDATSAAQAVARAARMGLIDRTPPARTEGPAKQATTGRPLLAVLLGQAGPTLDTVQRTLIEHRLPVVREPPRSGGVHIGPPRVHRGPVIRVLAGPTSEHWRPGTGRCRSTVLIHDGAIDQLLVEYALSQGVVAIIHAGDVADRLIPVLELVAAGYMAMDPAAGALITESLWTAMAHRSGDTPTLTPREHDILRCIGRNCTVRQTARALGIAAKTVENAQSHLFRKLGVANRAAALARAYSLGLLHPEPP
ncbi:LuxR C-terminal-related transcriptional regulator [Actinoplanes sp. CA-030573]|uniref:LuxR C-terminal-related transcriptional regulator n=1 Tax=Actinoplanes sp. CA-030573 TaxID=3239898 RepID=UPI003D90625E